MSNYNTQLQNNNTDLQKNLYTLYEYINEEDKFIEKTISGTYINNKLKNIAEYAFNNCIYLTSVNFPACTNIGKNAFRDCSSLTSVSFPTCTNISEDAFGDCSNLTSVSFPTCKTIGNYAFRYCSRLSSITLGASTVCTLVNSNAFYSTPYTGYRTHFSGTPHMYVPASLVNAYKNATNWTYFSSYFHSIESLEV